MCKQCCKKNKQCAAKNEMLAFLFFSLLLKKISNKQGKEHK
jgi:hypothetical protein